MASDEPHPDSGNESYLFESAAPRIHISLDFGVVDKIAADALRGLGALPRRGMEVGGLLLGSVDAATLPLRVRIRDCVPFACEHLYGPSFQLSPKDREAMKELVATWPQGRGAALGAVGLYRSHTRGEIELTAEDVELLDAFFPQAHAACLLVRPFAMRAGEAAFYLRRGGAFQAGPPARTFPFRRKELGGGATPRGSAASTPERTPQPPPRDAALAPAAADSGDGGDSPAMVDTILAGEDAEAPPLPAARSHPGWLWFTSLIVFLLTGVLIGVQVAGGWRQPASQPPSQEPFSLGLSALQFGEAIHFRWNPQAPALLACQSASLTIRDGDNTKIIDLGKDDLARGALIYRHASPDVQFRLEAVFSPGNSLSESIHLRLLPPAGASASAPAAIR